jgi:hypothetical protein
LPGTRRNEPKHRKNKTYLSGAFMIEAQERTLNNEVVLKGLLAGGCDCTTEALQDQDIYVI